VSSNSLRRSKIAVQSGLGSGLLRLVSIERELATGKLNGLPVADLLWWPASAEVDHPPSPLLLQGLLEAFRREVLPEFASPR